MLSDDLYLLLSSEVMVGEYEARFFLCRCFSRHSYKKLERKKFISAL
jgi:hypothetical protein